MKKWGIIALIAVIALACGITAADLWGYIVELINLGVEYFFDLCSSIIDTLTGKVTETVSGTIGTFFAFAG